MDQLSLTVTYGKTAIRTFRLGPRLCWLEVDVNSAFGQKRPITDDARAIRGVDYEVLCPREACEIGPWTSAGATVLFDSGLALAANDCDDRAKHLRALLLAAAECRAQVEHIGVHAPKP